MIKVGSIGFKEKNRDYFKKNTEIDKMPIGGSVVVEVQKRSKNTEIIEDITRAKLAKERERRKFIKKLCDEHDVLGKILSIQKNKTHYYTFYQYNHKRSLKKLFDKPDKFMPDKQHEEQALKILKEIVNIYQILKAKGMIHRMIRPEFLFYDNQGKLRMSLFGFCSKEKYLVKTTIDKSRNKPAEAIVSVADNVIGDKEYNFKGGFL